MEEKEMFTEEQMDFLKEAMNIGVGNAANALTQLLGSNVKVKIPGIYILSPKDMHKIVKDPSSRVVCVKISTVGDILGEVLFIISDKDKAAIIHLTEKSYLGRAKKGHLDISVLSEIGNIMTGVYMTSIHDFCKLNIYHSVPEIKSDMFQSIVDEIFIGMGRIGENFIVVENEFIVESEGKDSEKTEHILKAYWLLVPSAKSVQRLINAVKGAHDILGIK